jgi:glycosyltransferase involved in cell wall biosynthesis
MNAPLTDPMLRRSETAQSAQKRRAVVFGGGIGMFPPLMKRLSQEFDVVANPQPNIGRAKATALRLLCLRWGRERSFRTWRYRMEKTPWAFDEVTRESERLLEPLRDRCDVILFFGAMHAPCFDIDKPMFVFTDSCRWLSARNAFDTFSHFRSQEDERGWLEREGHVYRTAKRVFVGSEYVRAAMIAHYGLAPEQVVNCGFGAGEGRTILYIGKGDFERKGGVALMQAFERVRARVPDAVLHVVGQERLGRVPGVVSHGIVRDRALLGRLMAEAHVFSLPSLIDRNPISLLEAMAAGTPCVSSDYGAMPEMVGDAGLVVPCNDVPALAEALLRILEDSRYARTLGERGRRRFEERYNWDSVWRVIQPEIRRAL